MTLIDEVLSRVESHFSEHDTGAKWLRAAIQGYAGIVFPVAALAWFSVVRALGEAEPEVDVGPWIWVLGAALMAFQAFALYLTTFRWRLAPSYFDFARLRDGYHLEIRERDERFTRTERQFAVTLQMQESIRYAAVALDNVRDLAAADEDATNDVEQAVGLIMEPVVTFRSELFGFVGPELFNFAYYEYRSESEQLELVWRECHERLDRSNRAWAPGMGHVGLCYARRRDLFSTDVRESETLRDDQAEGDDCKYVSLASIPVFEVGHFPADTIVGDTPPPPTGVLVLTSSEPGQFDKDAHRTFLLTVSYLLSLALERVTRPTPPTP